MEASAPAARGAQELRYVEPPALERLRAIADPVLRARAVADASRINTLSAIMEAGSGHVGTSFSVMDILAWLHLEVLRGDDACFSSKGHDAPAVYAVLAATGKLDFGRLRTLRRFAGLPGHPDIAAVPAVVTNTGSLGMGVSKAKGLARAARLRGGRRRVFVVCGDGELQEGQFWESLGQAANEGLGEITVIVDHNRIQSDTWVEHVSPLGDLEAKAGAFGWAAGRCDGHDVAAFSRALDTLLARPEPGLLIADTVKGRGARAFEPHGLERSPTALYAFHSGAPAPAQYEEALAEIVGRLPGVVPASRPAPAPRPAPQRPQRLVDAYGRALVAAAEGEPRLVVLDADLALDCGLTAFRARFPERFVECGIAEQDMVSQAGGLALGGMLPAVHSFAAFLGPRAAEQAFNNASERTRVIYAGMLAGLVPGGPGHSHQSIRDIALMGSIPGMSCLEPAGEHEVALCLDWAVREAPGPVYLRLVSVPWDPGFELPAAERLEPGRGTVVRADGDVVVVCTGPVLAAEAHAVERAALVLVPWLRDIDGAWLSGVAGGRPIAVLDNHWVRGGQGDAVRAALAGEQVSVLGVDRLPEGGGNEDVLRAHGLDAASLRERLP